MKQAPLPFLLASVISVLFMPSGDNGLQELSLTKKAYAEEAAAVKYTCPMHPQIVSDSPGKCPICGMDLVPLKGAHEHGEDDQSQVIVLSDEQLQIMNVRMVKVANMNLPRDAIMQTPDGSHVVVALGDGKFTTHPVTVENISNDKVAIVSGVQDGQEVVVEGQFLIDAELNLRKNSAGDSHAH